MTRSTRNGLVLALVIFGGAVFVEAQQRGAQPPAAPAAAQPQETTPPLLFKEIFQQVDAGKGVPTSPRRSNNQYWLAGQTATKDEQGNDISGNFEAQVRTIFSLIDKTLKRVGGSLANMVTMTVFINDPRHGDKFVEMRGGFFPDGNFPASALITVSHFARPGMLIEIQGVAVIGG